MWGDVAIAFLLAFIVAFMGTPYTIKIAHKVGAVDVPKDERRLHKKAMPKFGGPAVIVGFSQSPIIGIIVLVIIVVVQFLEGNLLQPLIMSKTTKLHPVTIMLGLLVFGYFFGIIGMVISTPIIAALKSIFMFFNDKYEFFNN